MDNEQMYEIAFQIIVHAGDSKSLANMAMDKIENYEFEEAEDLLQQAKDQFLACHQIQTDMLTSEANGEKNEINVIFIHAQDHLTMATMAMDNANRLMKLYKKLKQMEDRL